jgi:hypothetical protein
VTSSLCESRRIPDLVPRRIDGERELSSRRRTVGGDRSLLIRATVRCEMVHSEIRSSLQYFGMSADFLIRIYVGLINQASR